MRLSQLGTFNNNEEVEMAVQKWLLIQEFDIMLYSWWILLLCG
jgi:hypothetical protein